MIFPSHVGEDPETRFHYSRIAGLQFYDYDEFDDVIGLVRPVPGDRFQLIRQPKNPHDRNAVEVWFRDGRLQLGHLPRELAAEIAPLMDRGIHVRAYAASEGDGRAWSASLMLVAKEIPLHLYAESVREAARYDGPDPAEAQRLQRAERWTAGWSALQDLRRKQAAQGLALVIAEEEDRSPSALPKPAPKSKRGKVFGWWDQIPTDGENGPVLRTRTQWGQSGFKVKQRVRKPFARIEYEHQYDVSKYDLYSSEQVTPKKRQSVRARASRLAKDVW